MTILVRRPAGRAESPDESPGAKRGPTPPRHRAPHCLRRPSRRCHEGDGKCCYDIASLLRRFHCLSLAVSGAALGAGCANHTARAPNPTAYDWPDELGYRLDYATRTERDGAAVSRSERSATLHFAVRIDGSFTAWHDSVRIVVAAGEKPPVAEPPSVEDTLHYRMRLSRWGEFLSIEPECDPALAACHAALPSALPRELRHLIPRLPVWWPPKGYAWADTLSFDDLPRAGGLRGSTVTVYRAARDTTVRGTGYWIVTWRSERRTAHAAAAGAIVADPAEEESGTVLVDKGRMIPAYAEWSGRTVPPPPGTRSAGVPWTEKHARAALVGGAFDSLRATAGTR